MSKTALTLAALLAATPALAADVTLYAATDSFEDVAFALEQAIVGRGLVVDYVSHVGEMLNRTGADVGSKVKLYDAANVYLFCSAVTSREVMEADPQNIAYCPYGVFVTDKDGVVSVGYRNYPAGSMQTVQALLDEIAREAAGVGN